MFINEYQISWNFIYFSNLSTTVKTRPRLLSIYVIDRALVALVPGSPVVKHYGGRGFESYSVHIHSHKSSGLKLITLAISCMLKGPDILSASATKKQTFLIFIRVSWLICRGGQTSVASPEWTPANSTCSETAKLSTSPSQATASTSISCKQNYPQWELVNQESAGKIETRLKPCSE